MGRNNTEKNKNWYKSTMNEAKEAVSKAAASIAMRVEAEEELTELVKQNA